MEKGEWGILAPLVAHPFLARGITVSHTWQLWNLGTQATFLTGKISHFSQELMEKLLLSESHEHMHNFHSCIHSHHYKGSTESNQTRCLWLWTQLVPFTVCWLWLPRWECPHLSGWLWFSFPFTAWFPQSTLNFTLLHAPLLIPLFNPNSFKTIESSKLFQPDQLPQEEKTNVLFLGSCTQFSVYNFFSPVVRLCWILLGVLILWSSTDPYLFHGCRGQGL